MTNNMGAVTHAIYWQFVHDYVDSLIAEATPMHPNRVKRKVMLKVADDLLTLGSVAVERAKRAQEAMSYSSEEGA